MDHRLDAVPFQEPQLSLRRLDGARPGAHGHRRWTDSVHARKCVSITEKAAHGEAGHHERRQYRRVPARGRMKQLNRLVPTNTGLEVAVSEPIILPAPSIERP